MSTFPTFPTAQSILDPEALLGVAAEFAVPPPTRCDFLRRGLNDTYDVHAGRERFALRVYRANRRTPHEISYEIDLLQHLAAKGLTVPEPVPRRSGGYLHPLVAAEGERQAALFTWMPGRPPGVQNAHFTERYAAAVGELHTAADDFRTDRPRPPLDLTYLLDQPLAALRMYLEDCPADLAAVERVAKQVRERISALASELDWGAVHGDASLSNLHVMPDGSVSFFDFDNAGPGWRANDTAAFFGIAQERGEPWIWAAFRRGYASRRHLSEAEIAVMPAFHVARLVMSLGFHAGNGIYWGVPRQREIVDAELAQLRRWEADYPTLTA